MKLSTLSLFAAVASYVQGKASAADVHFPDSITCSNTMSQYYEDLTNRDDDPTAAPFGTPKGEAWTNLDFLFRSLDSSTSSSHQSSNCQTINHNGKITYAGEITYSDISCDFLNNAGAVKFWDANIAPPLQAAVDWYLNNATTPIPNGGISEAYSVICPCPHGGTINTNFDGCKLQVSLKNAQQCAAH